MTSYPINNVGQQLFSRDLPNCSNRFNQPNFKPNSCCGKDQNVESWYKKTPSNLLNVSSYDGEQAQNSCTNIAFAKQCFMSQYYNYLSGNNHISN